jgi:uncharacterized protein (DUF58 family)
VIEALFERHPGARNWFYGFTPPERGVVVLGHRRVYIVPARLGWLFAATVLMLLIGSINYALSLGFVLTFMLAGMGLAGMVHTARNLARVAVSTGRCEPVFVGEPAQFRLHLDSGASFDRPAILARHIGSGSQLVVDIPAGGLVDVVLAVPGRKRGWMPLRRVMLETRFPLGLFRAWSYIEPEANCLIYPKPELSPLPAPSPDSASGTAQTQSLGNDDFAGLRTYQLSDSPRHVAWKSVARTDDMLTKQFTGQAAAQLWLDWQLLPAYFDLEKRLSRLTGWVLAAERIGAHYGLRLPGTEIPMGTGEAHRASCLRALALYASP